MKYTYRAFDTGKFIGWKYNPIGVACAVFQRKTDQVWVPEYLLERESLEALPLRRDLRGVR